MPIASKMGNMMRTLGMPDQNLGASTQLDIETAARLVADSSLQANITSEITARANADLAEVTARANADLAEITARSNAINAEVTARTNADSTLTTNLNSEITARQNADSTLQASIQTLGASTAFASETATVIAGVLTPTTDKPIQRIVAGSANLDSIANPVAGEYKILINESASPINVTHNTGASSTSIFTGTGASISLASNAALTLVYDASLVRWVVIGGVGGGSASQQVTQVSHGFSVGQCLYLNGSTYTLAQANTANTAETVGVVTNILSADIFQVTELGYTKGLSGLTAGTVYFLSDSVAGALTATEPTVVGSISKPLLLADSATSGYVLNYRGSVVGGANARTQVALTNNATSPVQDVSGYDAGDLAGWVYINATTSYRFYINAKWAKNGAGTDFNLNVQTTGDTPPIGFSLTITSGGLIQATLPSISGFVLSVINYALNAPAIGTAFPLTVSGYSVLNGTPSVLGLTAYDSTGLTFNKAINFVYTAVTTATILNHNYYYVSASGSSPYAITLPTAVGIAGRSYVIKSNMDVGVSLTVNTTSSQTIDGLTSKSLARYEALSVISNGQNWEIF